MVSIKLQYKRTVLTLQLKNYSSSVTLLCSTLFMEPGRCFWQDLILAQACKVGNSTDVFNNPTVMSMEPDHC